MRVASAVAVGLGVVALVAVAAWRFDARTRPDAVGPRFVEALTERKPGTTVAQWEGGYLRVALASGLYVDVRIATVFAACRARRLECNAAVATALDDVDAVERGVATPDAARLVPMVLAEATPGHRYGFVTDPLIGPLEVRYALAIGVASTFVTSALMDRLALTRPALREAALASLAREPDATLVAEPDATGAAVYRVASTGDPVASLLDAERMRRFADRVGSGRVDLLVARRGSLDLAASTKEGRAALLALRERRGGRVELLTWDAAAAAGSALSSSPSSSPSSAGP